MTDKKDPKFVINALVRQRDAALARVVELEAHIEFMQEAQARAVHDAQPKASHDVETERYIEEEN